jgi:phage virion morphogenesis protein
VASGVQMRGATPELRQLQRRLDFARQAGFRRSLLKNLATEGLVQVAVSFDKQQDPYGVRWQPWARSLGQKRRGGKILTDTARLRNSFRASATSETFTISSRVAYAAIHQYGGNIGQVSRIMYHKASGRQRGRLVTKRRAEALWAKGKAAKVSFAAGGGVTTMPPRPFLPSSGRLGPRWTLAFSKVATLVFAKAVYRRGVLGGRK